MKPQRRVAVDVLTIRQVGHEALRLKPPSKIIENSSGSLIVIVVLIANNQMCVSFVVKRTVAHLLQFVRQSFGA